MTDAITLTLPVYKWVFLFIALFSSSKAMQASGILYARGQDWHGLTLVAALLLLVPSGFVALSLIVQNVGVQ